MPRGLPEDQTASALKILQMLSASGPATLRSQLEGASPWPGQLLAPGTAHRLSLPADRAPVQALQVVYAEHPGSRGLSHVLASSSHAGLHTSRAGPFSAGWAGVSSVKQGSLSRDSQVPRGSRHKAWVTSDTIRVAVTLIQSD